MSVKQVISFVHLCYWSFPYQPLHFSPENDPWILNNYLLMILNISDLHNNEFLICLLLTTGILYRKKPPAVTHVLRLFYHVLSTIIPDCYARIGFTVFVIVAMVIRFFKPPISELRIQINVRLFLKACKLQDLQTRSMCLSTSKKQYLQCVFREGQYHCRFVFTQMNSFWAVDWLDNPQYVKSLQTFDTD